jgi:hypothetical protein
MSRISIQYSIETDELENEMFRLIENSLKKLDSATESLHAITKKFKGDNALLSSETTARLSLVRQKLADVDFTIGDATNIIGGYVNYQIESQMAAANAPSDMSENYSQEGAPPSTPTPEMYEHEFEDPQLNPYTKNGTSEMVKDLDAFENLVEKITSMSEDELHKFRGFSQDQLLSSFMDLKDSADNGG